MRFSRSVTVAPWALARVVLCALCAVAAGSACAAPEKDTRYPARKEGCDVAVFPANPPMSTENIGPVTAICGGDVSNDDCMRTLKDEACKLGGDVVWGVDDIPSNVQGKKRLAGRAAHTKAAGK